MTTTAAPAAPQKSRAEGVDKLYARAFSRSRARNKDFRPRLSQEFFPNRAARRFFGIFPNWTLSFWTAPLNNSPGGTRQPTGTPPTQTRTAGCEFLPAFAPSPAGSFRVKSSVGRSSAGPNPIPRIQPAPQNWPAHGDGVTAICAGDAQPWVSVSISFARPSLSSGHLLLPAVPFMTDNQPELGRRIAHIGDVNNTGA